MIAYDTIDLTGRTFFRDVIYPVYYFVLGSFDNERTQLDGRNICMQQINKYRFLSLATRDASTALATHIIFALHMLFVNILLINLLIALFRYVKLTNLTSRQLRIIHLVI